LLTLLELLKHISSFPPFVEVLLDDLRRHRAGLDRRGIVLSPVFELLEEFAVEIQHDSAFTVAFGHFASFLQDFCKTISIIEDKQFYTAVAKPLPEQDVVLSVEVSDERIGQVRYYFDEREDTLAVRARWSEVTIAYIDRETRLCVMSVLQPRAGD
jgi:hypothetical protein